MLRRIRLALHRATLPRHPRTGERALGLNKAGFPFWRIAGGSQPTPPADPPPADPPAPPPTPPADPPKPSDPPADPDPDDKTDWKAEARKWETRAKENREKATKLDELEAANATELEKATKLADENAARAAAADARAIKAEVRALADGFTDRDDAVLNLGDDLTRFLKDGEIDTKTIAAELKKILESKPHLAKAEEPAGPPKPGQPKPVERLKPGGAPPGTPAREASLSGAVSAFYDK